MQLKFFGAAGTVTGSRYLLDTGEKKILVDCGLFQGYKPLRLRNRAPFPVSPAQIDDVVLTHAHLDHSGYLPLLVRNGFAGRILCTPATRHLCRILLRDSGHLQEREAEYANHHAFSKHRPALPLYTLADAERSLSHFVPAFAVGRAQDLLYLIGRLKASKQIPAALPVFLDSPMATEASRIFHEHREDHRLSREECDRTFAGATYVRNVQESKALNVNPTPKVIISASGMATGGRVLHHLKNLAPDPRSTLLFAGFQAGGTRRANTLRARRLGIGPALEARDVLYVLQGDARAPLDLRDRALALAAALLELTGAAPPGSGTHRARAVLDEGRAWRKFQRICEAQGGMRTPPVSSEQRAVLAAHDGRVASIDNRRLAKVAKLAGAPDAKAAGVDLNVHVGARVSKGDLLYTIHAQSRGELEYASAYAFSTIAITVDES